MVMGEFLMVSDVPSELLHPIISHGNHIRLLHIHIYKVPISLFWPWIYVLDEKELIIWTLNFTFKLS